MAGGTSAVVASEYVATRGRPPLFGPEVVEEVLWEIAVCGGNCARALQQLRESRAAAIAGDVDEHQAAELTSDLPTAETARRWIRGRYRNRYFEISNGRARELEERLATRQVQRAMQLHEIEEQAMDQIAGRMGGLDAVEAAKVLQSVAAAKKMATDSAQSIRKTQTQAEDSRTVRALAEGLARLGVAEFVDSTAVEEGVGELPAPSSHDD